MKECKAPTEDGQNGYSRTCESRWHDRIEINEEHHQDNIRKGLEAMISQAVTEGWNRLTDIIMATSETFKLR